MERLKRFIIVDFVSAIFIILLMAGSDGLDFLLEDGGERFFLSFIAGLLPAMVSLFFPTKKEKEEKKRNIEAAKKEAERKRKEREEAEERERERRRDMERARTAPGRYEMSNVDLLTFGSRNNILTAGNNQVCFKIRNRNPYDVIVDVRFKYSDGWESGVHSYQVGGNNIRTVETLGKAWRKAMDITIIDVH